MTIYLTIITTVLVLTQIIRVAQNHIQLKHIKYTDKLNEELMKDWERIILNLEEIITRR